MGMEELPAELWLMVARSLTGNDIVRLSAVSHKCRGIAHNIAKMRKRTQTRLVVVVPEGNMPDFAASHWGHMLSRYVFPRFWFNKTTSYAVPMVSFPRSMLRSMAPTHDVSVTRDCFKPAGCIFDLPELAADPGPDGADPEPGPLDIMD